MTQGRDGKCWPAAKIEKVNIRSRADEEVKSTQKSVCITPQADHPQPPASPAVSWYLMRMNMRVTVPSPFTDSEGCS